MPPNTALNAAVRAPAAYLTVRYDELLPADAPALAQLSIGGKCNLQHRQAGHSKRSLTQAA